MLRKQHDHHHHHQQQQHNNDIRAIMIQPCWNWQFHPPPPPFFQSMLQAITYVPQVSPRCPAHWSFLRIWLNPPLATTFSLSFLVPSVPSTFPHARFQSCSDKPVSPTSVTNTISDLWVCYKRANPLFRFVFTSKAFEFCVNLIFRTLF